MTPLYKHIIASVCALLIIAYMVFGLWMSCHTVPDAVCKHLNVRILDEQNRQYVSSNEIAQLITNNGANPVGKTGSHIALQPMENMVRQHSMVRTAECYKSEGGDVCVLLTQRVPLVRVVTSAESYFVDTDRKIMPVRESVKTPVLVATGNLSRRMAANEVSDFAQWLQHDRFWRKYIGRVHVINPKMVHLRQSNGRAEIILGDWNGYENKLNKLRRWYEADTLIHQEQYQQVDLRFHGQVVGIKN